MMARCALLGVLAALLNMRHLSCCIAAGFLSWLLVIVFISFGLHGLLGVIFGDLCLEMDLSLHYPAGEPVSIPFLPADMNPCGDSGQFTGLLTEIEDAASGALASGAVFIADFCNKDHDFEDLRGPTDPRGAGASPIDFGIDCTAASGTGKLLTGSFPNYAVQPASTLTLGMFADAKNDIMITDVGVADASCKSDAETYNADTNKCPNEDPDGDCVPACGGQTITVSGVSVTLDACENAEKSLQQCGGRGVGKCAYPALQQMSCLIVDGLSALDDLNGFSDLLENDIRPVRPPPLPRPRPPPVSVLADRRGLVFQLLQCEFIKDVFSGMYMPLCVDSMNGFGMVTAANGLGGFVMIIMIPFSIMATKRYNKENTGAAGAVVDDSEQKGGYVGA